MARTSSTARKATRRGEGEEEEEPLRLSQSVRLEEMRDGMLGRLQSALRCWLLLLMTMSQEDYGGLSMVWRGSCKEEGGAKW